MRTKLWVGLILVGALMLVGQIAGAAPRPAVITFDSSLKVITAAEVEAGTAVTTLSWYTTGMDEEYRLALHTYLLDGWKPVFPDEGVPLETSGSREVTVQPTLNFGPPTYLLSIVNIKTNNIVDQRIVTIPYDTAAQVEPPAIAAFSAEVTEVDGAKLVAGQVQVMVSWEVTGRLPSANLVFEQVFADNLAASVELPRPYLWIPSVGQGPLAPVFRAGEELVVLRLSVVDIVSSEIYAEQMIELPVINAPVLPPATVTPAPTLTPAPQPTPVANEIVSFAANPTTVNPGSAVTLSWEVIGTGGVTIEQAVPNVPGTSVVVNAQSPKGSAEIYLPDFAAYSVTFTLYSASRTSTAQAKVEVYCPTAFFFGEGDGCPSSQVIETGAVYQSFENGSMVWRQDTNEVYVFFSDNTAAYFLERDYANLPDPQIPEAPPLDRQAPGSGFGKVWANAPGVRAKLGWALDVEQGYNTRAQGVAPTRDPRPAFTFYLTLPGGEVIGSGYGQW
ncbi:MAG: hypothetical protein HY866_03065, partial [Chloroflexi bacterium]|nr:hypothetical protein [Chloroflexota bacterium]